MGISRQGDVMWLKGFLNVLGSPQNNNLSEGPSEARVMRVVTFQIGSLEISGENLQPLTSK